VSKGYSLPEKYRGRDKSGQGIKASERGALTDWRVQQEGHIRTKSESKQARGTHARLENTEGGTSQDKK